jgi:transcriptional regulator with XRE-family HTH domain
MPGRRNQHNNRSPLAVRLGLVIREARLGAGLTQEQLAEHASLSKNAVGNIERGEFAVTVATLKRISEALGLRAARLLDLAGI